MLSPLGAAGKLTRGNDLGLYSPLNSTSLPIRISRNRLVLVLSHAGAATYSFSFLEFMLVYSRIRADQHV
jgi:hypothetical protein